MADVLNKCGHIIVVDDDAAIRAMVVSYFKSQGFRASGASNRSELNGQIAISHPSVILLDLRLGDQDGLNLLAELRLHTDVPVIIVTGHYIDEVDRVVGLELGADAYLVKPFNLRELLARVRAILRRQELGRLALSRDPGSGGYRFGGWRLDRRDRRLLDPQNEQVSLSRREYVLLLAFLESPQRPLSREYLLQATRTHEDIFDRSIDVQVWRLRRKLEIDPRATRFIQTVRGVGYIFDLQVEPF